MNAIFSKGILFSCVALFSNAAWSAPTPVNLGILTFYDSADNVKRIVKQAGPNGPGLAVMMEYDSLNRMVKRTIQREEASTIIEDQSTFTYEPLLDNPKIIKTAANSVVTYTFEHETAPPFAPTSFSVRATDPSNPYGIVEDTYTIQWGFTGITSVTNSAGHVIYSKTYDPAGRLLSVQSGGFTANLGYDGFGRRTGTTYSDGTAASFSYDLLNRVTDLTWNGAKPAQVHLQYDLAGNVSQVTRENGSYSMAYDNVNQLLSVTSQGSGNFVPYNRSFSYDAVGNRIGDSQNGTGTFVSNFLTRNSYASYNPDPDGTGAVCQIKNSSTQAVRQFTYRADGSLVSFTDGTTRVDYAYDPYGRRIAKVVHQGGNTYTQSYTYLTGEDDVMLAKAGDGSITIYLHGQGPNVQLAEVKNGVGKGYTTDHVGGVLNGDVAGAANAFGIFGEVVTPPNLSVSSNPVMYGFAGMTFDPESGNYQSQGLRQYDPQVGRWNQQEPTGLDGPNYYHYVFSNPMTHIDPTGQNTRIVTQVGHEVLEVDDPDHPGQVISIGLGPDWKKTTLGDVIKGPVPGYVDISSGRAGGGFVIPGTEVTQSRQEDAWILQQAKMLQQAFSNGDLQFDVLGWNTNGNATNCAGFASSLQHSGGM